MSGSDGSRKTKTTTKATKPSKKAEEPATQASARRVLKPKTAAVTDPVLPAQSRMPASEDQIRERAYLNWQAAGQPDGDGLCFWLQAEQELSQKT